MKTVSLSNKNIINEQRIIWNSKSLSEALEVVLIDVDCDITSVSIDSRTLNSNALFIALKGEHFNGNDFVMQAMENGALFCIVDEEISVPENFKKRLILVENSLTALYQLARYRRSQFKGKIVGITGSVGKTSTKEMLKLALSQQGDVFASYGNFNNHYGLPLSLANMPVQTDFGIFEMGMSGPHEIKELSKLCKPDVALITNVEPVHLEFFKTVTDIALAKAEIFEGMRAGVSTAIINSDNPYHLILEEKARNLRIVTFAESEKANFKLLDFGIVNGTTHIKAEYFGNLIDYSLGVVGKQHIINSLGVLAVVHALEAEVENAAFQLKHFKAHFRRGEIIKLNNNIVLIDDSYNSSPAALRYSLQTLSTFKNADNRTIAVLGDMKELGVNAIEFHKDMLTSILDAKVDLIFTVGALMKNLFDVLPVDLKGLYTEDSTNMANKILEYTQPSDVILIKGSFSTKMDEIVKKLTENYQIK